MPRYVIFHTQTRVRQWGRHATSELLQKKRKREIPCHDFHVVRNGNGAVLGYKTAKDLGLIQFINKVTKATSAHPNLFRGKKS